jgi:hypothetical protein
VGPYSDTGRDECVGAVVVDRPPGDRAERDADSASPLAAGTDGPSAPPPAGWPDLAPSEQEGLVALMAQLSLRAVRHARQEQGDTHHDEHTNVEDPR